MPYGTGLDTAFNQDEPQQNINTHPKKVKTPEGLKKESVDYDKIQHLKVGEMVAYTKGQGTIVRKDGAYVTIFNEDAGAYDQVHAGETYIPGDTISMGIMNQLWDQMNYETRMASLHKAEVQEPLHFVDRKWNELPSNLKEVIQKKGGSPVNVKINPIDNRDDPKVDRVAQRRSGQSSIASAHSNLGELEPDSMAGNKESKEHDIPKHLEGKTPLGKSENIEKLSPSSVSYGSRYGGGRRPTSLGGEKQQERSAFNPGGEYAGGGGTSRTFTPGGRKTKPKENLGPESKRKPAGADAGPAAEAAAARSTGNTEPKKETYTSVGWGVKDVPPGAKQDVKPSKQKPAKQTSKPKEDGGVTFASGLDKATSYGELATEIYKLRNQLNKYTGSKIPNEKLGDLPQGKNRLKPAIGGTKIETHEGEKELKSPADRYKSDVEHGAYGGVVTDTPFDAEGDYEEDKRDVHGKEFDHNHQQKTPRDPKEDGDEVIVGYHTKEDGSMTTSTEGANNPVANNKKEEDDEEKERSITNKYNSRYGIRKASKEDIERLTK